MHTISYDNWVNIADNCPITFCRSVKLINKHHYNIYLYIRRTELLRLNTITNLSSKDELHMLTHDRIGIIKGVNDYDLVVMDNILMRSVEPVINILHHCKYDPSVFSTHFAYGLRRAINLDCCVNFVVDKYDIYNDITVIFETYSSDYYYMSNFTYCAYTIWLLVGNMRIYYLNKDLPGSDPIWLARINDNPWRLGAEDNGYYGERICKYIFSLDFDINKAIPGFSDKLMGLYNLTTET